MQVRELWAHAPALVSAVEDAASIGAGRHVSLPRVPAPASDSGGRAGKGAAVAGPELQVRLARCLSCAHAAESRGSALCHRLHRSACHLHDGHAGHACRSVLRSCVATPCVDLAWCAQAGEELSSCCEFVACTLLELWTCVKFGLMYALGVVAGHSASGDRHQQPNDSFL